MENEFKFRDLGAILKDTYKEWNDDDAFTHAAAVSYYAIFSLPAILIILINVAGLIFGKEAIQGEISKTIGNTIGPNSAQQIQTMIQNANVQANSTVMLIIGIGVLVLSATTLFMQMQKALNRMWEVKTREDAGILKVIFDRTKTFGIVLTIGFLLLISMAVTGVLTALSKWLTSLLPDFTIYIFHVLNFAISLGIITCMFAMIFKCNSSSDKARRNSFILYPNSF
ncbi:MAG: YihY/virulence factor BrkB family protein [Sporocytophaga sp.]|uniref:YihY/virulence factor BrkB family protein n=1 Tax=Sporocytophaga sp. TaxID=2231183 RepID=UPI001B255D6B|nr:YihY/virulence factor BrkB family protein [Sporocytophaga sp.]MBO9702990.1 YihY/virulence factor BrkB family protein [Sporocytophaga sp.]